MSAKLKIHLYCTAAVIVAAWAGGAQAQEATTSGDNIETVVVTGQRAAITSAISIKENADTIVNSVSAEDVGRLPDNSVTEVLQRIPGVNITRIQTGGGSENYLGEGTGISIRGLDSTVSLLNGRDSFSAANGRNLSWEDVPPELAQGIDVYKSLSASLPEGGFGGVVNLRTRQPFDFDGFAANATLTGNYADWSKKGHVGGVGLISDRWQTGIGEIGLLLNVAYSDLSTKADGVQVLPYAPTVYNPAYSNSHGTTLPSLSDAGSTEVYVPGGFGFTRRNDDRTRLGLYMAAQWRPNEHLEFFATALQSRYTDNSLTDLMFLGSGVLTVLAPNTTSTFDSQGNLLTTNGLSGFMWGFGGIGLPNQNSWGYEPIAYTMQTQYSHAVNSTTDISVGGEWNPTDNFSAKFALQYVNSTATQDDNAAGLYTFIADYGITLSPYGSAALPKLTFSDQSTDLTNAANYGWEDTMPHKLHNYGRELAGYLDTIYTVSDTGFLRSIKTGLKITARGERDNETTYNWRELTPWYVSPPINYLSADTSKGQLVDLSNMYNGQVGLPAAIYFPTKAATLDPALLQQTYNTADNYGSKALAVFDPYTLATLNEVTATGYAMASFAKDNFAVPFNGNIGVRVVAYRDRASGYHFTPDITDSSLDAANTVLVTADKQPSAVTGGHSQVDALPSLNIQFLPLPELHVRFAASQAVSRPTFAQMDPRGYVNGTYAGTYISYFGGSWGNPDLKPEKAEQLDGSIEYYFKSGGLVHIDGFYKQIHNFISTTQAVVPTTFSATVVSGSLASSSYCSAATGGATCTVDASVTEYFNETQTATVDGFEVGLQKYADFLPDPFDGLGVDLNYTYIRSSQPGALAFDMHGARINGLPLTGLSKNTVNASLMYDKGPLSLRVAYNWRDDFLVSTAAWQTGGIYNNIENINYGGSAQQGTVTNFALPVFQYPVGTLDANLTYNLTDNVSWTLEASNLTRSTTRLYMMEGYTSSGSKRLENRSWYMADTRYTTQLRIKF